MLDTRLPLYRYPHRSTLGSLMGKKSQLRKQRRDEQRERDRPSDRKATPLDDFNDELPTKHDRQGRFIFIIGTAVLVLFLVWAFHLIP